MFDTSKVATGRPVQWHLAPSSVTAPCKIELQYFYSPRKLKCLSPWQKLSSGLCLDKDMTLTAVSFTAPDPEVSEALSSKGLTSLWKSSNNHDVSFGYYSLLSFSLCSCSLSGFTVSSQLEHLFSSLFFSCQPATLPLSAVWPASCHSCFLLTLLLVLAVQPLLLEAARKDC